MNPYTKNCNNCLTFNNLGEGFYNCYDYLICPGNIEGFERVNVTLPTFNDVPKKMRRKFNEMSEEDLNRLRVHLKNRIQYWIDRCGNPDPEELEKIKIPKKVRIQGQKIDINPITDVKDLKDFLNSSDNVDDFGIDYDYTHDWDGSHKHCYIFKWDYKPEDEFRVRNRVNAYLESFTNRQTMKYGNRISFYEKQLEKVEHELKNRQPVHIPEKSIDELMEERWKTLSEEEKKRKLMMFDSI